MKTACVYHSVDLDGWMSAAIVRHWWRNNNLDSKEPTEDTLCMIGYNYGQPIPDLSEYDKVIMCDISFPKEEMFKFWHNLSKEIIWIDHHISAINDNNNLVWKGLQDTKFAACELTWKYFFPNKQMPEIVRLLGRYDCFGHKGTSEEQKVLEFQYGARQCINDYESAYQRLKKSILDTQKGNTLEVENAIHLTGISIYKYLCTEAKQTYKNGFEIKLVEEITDAIGKNIVNRKFICINKERFNPINFGINYHKDGYDGCACFHYANGMYNFSLYNDNGKVDCSAIAKQFGGGGHKGAAGFTCDNNTFLSFIKNHGSN